MVGIYYSGNHMVLFIRDNIRIIIISMTGTKQTGHHIIFLLRNYIPA